MNNRDDDGNDSDDSQKTVDLETQFEISKKIKKERRSRSASPTQASEHPHTEPPVDVKPDKRLLDERVERQRSRSTSRSRSSLTQGSNSSRDHRQRSRERLRDSRGLFQRQSPVAREESAVAHSYSRSSTNSRRSNSSSATRKTQHMDNKRRRNRSRSRSRSRDRCDSAEPFDSGPREIPWRCEQCDERDNLVVRSVGCQKSQGMADTTTQTCEKLKEKSRQPTVTPEQLRAVNELRNVLNTDITPVQLAKFVVAEFGRRNPHDWDRTMEENERFMYPGRVAFEEDHNLDPALPIGFPPSRQLETGDRHFHRSMPNERNLY